MNPSPGDLIQLGAVRYRVIERLGSGAVASAFRVAFADADSDVALVVKLPGIQDPTRFASIRKEAEVLHTLNAAEDNVFAKLMTVEERAARAAQTRGQRTVIALYDDGEIDGAPYLTQELAPSEVRSLPVQTLAEEQRIVAIMTRVARAMTVAHENGYSLKDFEPPYKSDRIRVEWPANSPTPVVLLIDWNITGGKEEAGDDIFNFGGHLYYLLTGRSLELLNGLPPHTLGMGVTNWNKLTTGMRAFLGKLLHRDEKRRHRRAADIAADLAWFEQIFQLVQQEGFVDRLTEQAFAQLGQNRPDRLLAIADLAARCGVTGEPAQTFEALEKRAQRELDKELIFAISMIEVSLGAQQFGQAIREADREMGHLAPGSDAATRVRHLRLLAQIGQELRQAGVDGPINRPEWQSLQQGIGWLAEQAWDAALQSFRRAEAQQPTLVSSQGLITLKNIAGAGQRVDQAVVLRDGAQPHGPDIFRQGWKDVEEQKLARLEQVYKLVEEAAQWTPDEPSIQEFSRIYKAEIDRRRNVFPSLEQAQSAWLGERFDQLAEPIGVVERLDRHNAYLTALRPHAERYIEYAALLATAQEKIAQGDYDGADAASRMAQQLLPTRNEWAGPQALARLGRRIRQEVADALREYSDKRPNPDDSTDFAALEGLRKQVQRLLDLDRISMRKLNADGWGVGAPPAGDALFALGVKLRSEIEELLDSIDKGIGRLRRARSNDATARLDALKLLVTPDRTLGGRDADEVRDRILGILDIELNLARLPSELGAVKVASDPNNVLSHEHGG